MPNSASRPSERVSGPALPGCPSLIASISGSNCRRGFLITVTSPSSYHGIDVPRRLGYLNGAADANHRGRGREFDDGSGDCIGRHLPSGKGLPAEASAFRNRKVADRQRTGWPGAPFELNRRLGWRFGPSVASLGVPRSSSRTAARLFSARADHRRAATSLYAGSVRIGAGERHGFAQAGDVDRPRDHIRADKHSRCPLQAKHGRIFRVAPQCTFDLILVRGEV